MNKEISVLDIPTIVKRHLSTKQIKEGISLSGPALLFTKDFAIIKNANDLSGFHPVKTDYYSVELCLNGSCQRKISHFAFEVYPSSIHLLSPGHVHSYDEESHDLSLYQVLFKKEFITEGFIKENILENLLEVNSDFAPIYGISEHSFRSVKAIYEKIEEEMSHTGAFHLQIIKLLLIELLYELNRACEKCLLASNRHLNRQYQLVTKFKKLIDVHYLSLKTVQEYADLLYVSAKYLTQVVKSQTGENALNLIHKRQYQEASYLLTTSSLSVKEIAERLNFDNSSHFSRFFKNHTGTNPTAFKTH